MRLKRCVHFFAIFQGANFQGTKFRTIFLLKPLLFHSFLTILMPSAIQLSCPPIPLVRIALIGLGERGRKTLERYSLYISGAEIRCIVDIDEAKLHAANAWLKEQGKPQAQQLCGAEAWKQACQLPDIDVVYICTEWRTHTPIAVEAMKCGKHAVVEVPSATTIEECWQLVRTAEQTQRHLFMAENCCYDFFALETLEMHRQGFFGSITHCEGAYIHCLADRTAEQIAAGGTRHHWMLHSCALHGGNPYPTHAIGPIAQLLDFHHSDRMESLVSITSKGVGADLQNSMGRINSTLIQTQNGVSILLQLDVTTSRPYNRLQTICGTEAFAQKYPLITVQRVGQEQALYGEEAEQLLASYAQSEAAQLWTQGHQMGVANEMNYAMDMRLVQCLQQGLPLDIDVYDAAEWSCLAELTQQSAQNGGIPVNIPNFRS